MIHAARAMSVALTLAFVFGCNGGDNPSSSTNNPLPGSTAPDNPSAPPVPIADDGGGSASPTPAPEPVEDPGPPAVQIIGRTDNRDSNGPVLGWPGVRIIANVQDAPSISVRMNETVLDSGPSEYDVAIDDQWNDIESPLILTAGDNTYTLASNLSPGTHKVEIYRRSEGQNGTTQFLGFDFAGGTLLPPPLHLKRKIEIVGDSDVSGFGYMGSITGTCLPGPDWSAHNANYRQAWGERLAQKLQAESNATVFSGKGFYYNIWRPDLEVIGILYPRSNPVDPSAIFDLNTYTPDAVVVSLGGNDYNEGQGCTSSTPNCDPGPAPLDGFTQKVRELTDTIRTQYPQTSIFLMAYAVLTDAYPPGYGRRTNVETGLRTVVDEHNAAGDAKVYFVDPTPSTDDELTACDGHGDAEYHERIAVYMADQMASKLSW
ncbi:MAG: GDSL-type esterase/lipase family protein [Polyangiaceae bacterium]|nr:GDSL-type esterase/lipase family protein [Polyangiaceae bacterium]